MITDGRVPGARSVPGGRSPCVLTCAPLGRDIAPGVAGGSVGATVPAPMGGYRLNSDQDRDSECGPFTLVYGCLKPAPNRHFPPLSATCSTIASRRVILCKFNGRHRMGTARGVLRRWRRRVAGAATNRHDKSMALFTMFFRPFWKPRALHWTPRALPLGFVVLAFQVGSWTLILHREIPSSFGWSGRGTGVDRGVFARWNGQSCKATGTVSLVVSISVLLRGVPASHRAGP